MVADPYSPVDDEEANDFVESPPFDLLEIRLTWQLAEQDSEDHSVRAFVSWAMVCLPLFAASCWLMTLPMDMRATMCAS